MPAAPQQQLTPLANLSTRPYQNDSPGTTNTLPPIQSQVNGFHYAPSYPRQDNNTTHTPPHAPSSQPPLPMSRNAAYPPVSQPSSLAQPTIPSTQPQGYGLVAPPYSGPPSHHSIGSAAPPIPHMNGSYAPLNAPMNAPINLPSIQQGAFDPYRGGNPSMEYANQGTPSRLQDGQGPHSAGQPPVVGSQGRRGILPSTMGRVPMTGPESFSRANVNPQKNHDGKYPCPYCPKTYLHLKHLKRHLLRRK